MTRTIAVAALASLVAYLAWWPDRRRRGARPDRRAAARGRVRPGRLNLDPSGALRAVATAHARVPFGLPDDVDVGADGTVYFTDASSKFRIHHDREDILEHGGHGRLLAYHPSTGRTELLLSGLQFANGVAVSGDGTYVLVNETGAYGSCGTGSRAPGAAPRRSSRTTFPGSRTT